MELKAAQTADGIMTRVLKWREVHI